MNQEKLIQAFTLALSEVPNKTILPYQKEDEISAYRQVVALISKNPQVALEFINLNIESYSTTSKTKQMRLYNESKLMAWTNAFNIFNSVK